MHETIIAQQIIEKAQELGKVKAITVIVGELAHVPAKDIYKILSELVSWDIKIETEKAVVQCNCGFTGNPKILEHGHDYAIFICPKCNKVPSQVLNGKDIMLKEVELIG